jgi:hypothetical protein
MTLARSQTSNQSTSSSQSESGYFRLIRESSTPYSIVHATQFFEFL